VLTGADPVVDFQRKLVKHLTEERNGRIGVIVNGGCTTFEHYREMVGECAGLEYAINHADELLKKRDKDEEDE
jgi:hypothetical protein